MFDLESTPVSIGSWIAIVLFITAFSQASKDKPADYNYTPNSDNIYTSGVNSISDIRFCPICGSVIEGETTFCGVCGSNL